MTVSTVQSSQTFIGNSTVSSFGFSFNNGVPFNSNNTLAVYAAIYTDTSGNQTVLAPSVYTLSFNAALTGALWGIGGTIVYPITGSPIASGTTLTLTRTFNLQQLISISNQGDFASQNIEAMGDIEEMQIQQIEAAVQRSIQIPVVDTGVDTILPSALQRANQYLAFDGNGNVSVKQGTSTPITSQPVDAGFASFVLPPLIAPAVIYTNGVPSGGLTGYTLPSGEAVAYNPSTQQNEITTIPAVNLTVGANLITDYYLNPNGSAQPWTITTVAAANYTQAIRYPALIHVWNIESNATDITAIYMAARTKPVPVQTTDAARVVDQIANLYVISSTHTNYSSGLGVTFGEIIVNTTTAPGNLYIVNSTGGNLGTSAPTTTAQASFTSGTATLSYYGQSYYGDNFRYSSGSGGIFTYFANIAAGLFTDLEGTSGTYIGETYVKPFFINQFYNLLVPRVNSGTYAFGQKIVAGGYSWINTTYAGGTVAGSSPFSGSYTPGVSTVADGGVIWKCIQHAYGSPTQAWFWFDTDRIMLQLNLNNAGDSNPTTFFAALWQYIQVTNDWRWLNGASPIPSGSGTFYTYAQCLGFIFDFNMATLYNNWTPTFQQNINPVDGTSFTQQYMEDNCESYSGFIAALNIFFFLLDNTRANLAFTNSSACGGEIFSLWNSTYGVFPWYLADNFSWVNNPANQWYPFYQAQLFPELHQTPATDQQKQAARAYLMTNWNNWPQDPGVTAGFPNVVFAYLAAKYWQDTDKARSLIDIAENQFLQDGLFINVGKEFLVNDLGYYLQTKKLLIANSRITRVKGEVVNIVDTQDNMTVSGATVTLAGAASVIVTYLDETVIINNASGSGVGVSLYIQTPTNGKAINIIDGAGNAATHNITITPYSGNINQASSFVISANSGQAWCKFGNGQWYAR